MDQNRPDQWRCHQEYEDRLIAGNMASGLPKQQQKANGRQAIDNQVLEVGGEGEAINRPLRLPPGETERLEQVVVIEF